MAGMEAPWTLWPPGQAPTGRPHSDYLPLGWAPGGSPHVVGFNPFPTLLTLADSPGLAGGGQEVPTAGITGWRAPRTRAARPGPSPTSRAEGSPFPFPGRRPQTSMELRGTRPPCDRVKLAPEGSHHTAASCKCGACSRRTHPGARAQSPRSHLPGQAPSLAQHD